jgi:glucoselysine-6-phosphate deglycase
LALVIPYQILAYKIATAKGIDLNKKIFEDFDQVLKSKL